MPDVKRLVVYSITDKFDTIKDPYILQFQMAQLSLVFLVVYPAIIFRVGGSIDSLMYMKLLL